MRQILDVIAGLLTEGHATAATLHWWELRYQHSQAVRSALAERYAPATANKGLAAMRGVLREAWRLGLLDAEAYQRAVDLAPVRGSRLPAGRNIEPGELRAMVEACFDGTAGGARDAALFALLAAGGLRRGEVVALDLDNLDVAACSLRVRGKGNKERMVYLTTGAMHAVKAWLAHRGELAGPLLCPVNKGGRVKLQRMSSQAIYERVRQRAVQAGCPEPTPHDFRRTFAGSLLDAGADISAVQRLMGHASVTTTQRYDRRGEQVKRDAASKLHFPYVAAAARSA